DLQEPLAMRTGGLEVSGHLGATSRANGVVLEGTGGPTEESARAVHRVRRVEDGEARSRSRWTGIRSLRDARLGSSRPSSLRSSPLPAEQNRPGLVGNIEHAEK